MNCPACANPLRKLHVEGVEVDTCEGGCGGLWFDNFELARFDEPHELAAAEALLMVPVDMSVEVDYQAKRQCPKCAVPMMRHFCTALRRTQVDACPQCGGNWLDVGELTQVRSEFREKAVRAAAKEQPVINKHLRWFVATD
ncbi:MAG: hypothetical protein FD161_1693 [Limisphaerales bacterium]|nr:MAG: hypothetical protein FD161_1693 [Limisphaerales bacterium]KAG0509302.1 MAG: hypothetical protein E1N63_1612 [Limisphaerales bacterium]TXT52160.1 MAG: hypothetical protein FD140_903 [Limisphaerales bacterium]